MGMLWARAGCYVLVPDQLGHGERRQHPFVNEKSYPGAFKVGRQDYYGRYNVAQQLHLVGESLIGWMVWDLMRGIDVLMAKPGIDKEKIIVLGSVAGGGDPCAVLAALDKRVTAAAPFNFGGPQPETKFPLPENADEAFNFMGGGSWESTRNLRLSGRDGFLPWVIVGALAPNRLIYAHEFAWDETRDPVWKRFQKIYGFYEKPGHLAEVHGRGAVTGKPPEATHCNNIGAEHRKGMHTAFAKWFDIDAKEYAKRVPSEELQCLTAEAKARFDPQPVWALAGKSADVSLAEARKTRAKLSVEQRRKELQKQWTGLLGQRSLSDALYSNDNKTLSQDAVIVQRTVLRFKDSSAIAIPLVCLHPIKTATAGKLPVVVAVAQGGKEGFIKHRAKEITRLLEAGVSVCLPDLRGTGETHPTGENRGRTSADTSLSASEWMHGDTLLRAQVQELLVVLDFLASDPNRPIALWGDSFALVNAADARLAVPFDADAQPAIGEPMGGLVTLLAGLFAAEGRVKAIHIRGGMASYRSVLQSPFFYIPHDSLVPGVLTVGDVDDLAALWAPRPLNIEAAIDGQNRVVAAKDIAAAFALTRAVAGNALTVREAPATPELLAAWFAEKLGQSKRGAGGR
jgi:hypothetical protein